MKKRILFLIASLFITTCILAQGLQNGNGVGTSTGNITILNSNPLTGTPTAGSFVRLDLNNSGTVSINVSGTYTGVLSAQASIDGGTTWQTYTNAFILHRVIDGTSSATITSAAVGVWLCDVTGLTNFRITALAAVTGTATVTIKSVPASQQTVMNSPLPTGANSIGNLGTVSTVSTLTGGGVAASSASSANPVSDGGLVVPTSIATQDQTYVAGDAARLPMTTGQQLIFKPYATAEIDWFTTCTAPLATTTSTAVKAASGTAGIRTYITGCQIINSSATVATEVDLLDGATVIWRGYVGTSALLNSVVGINFNTPLKTTANTAFNIQLVTTGSAVYYSCQGYTGF